MSPVVTNYVCDGCGEDVPARSDAFWITVRGFGTTDRYAHLIVHGDACARRYFEVASNPPPSAPRCDARLSAEERRA